MIVTLLLLSYICEGHLMLPIASMYFFLFCEMLKLRGENKPDFLVYWPFHCPGSKAQYVWGVTVGFSQSLNDKSASYSVPLNWLEINQISLPFCNEIDQNLSMHTPFPYSDDRTTANSPRPVIHKSLTGDWILINFLTFKFHETNNHYNIQNIYAIYICSQIYFRIKLLCPHCIGNTKYGITDLRPSHMTRYVIARQYLTQMQDWYWGSGFRRFHYHGEFSGKSWICPGRGGGGGHAYLMWKFGILLYTSQKYVTLLFIYRSPGEEWGGVGAFNVKMGSYRTYIGTESRL